MQLFPILFATAISLVILRSYTTTLPAFLLPVLVCVCVVFRFCTYVQTKKPRVYVSLLALFMVISLVSGLLFFASYDMSFSQWIFLNTSGLGYDFYLWVIYLLCCTMIPAAVYYFTLVRYRAPMLLIIVIIAYALNYTRYTQIPAYDTALLTALFFIVMVFFGNSGLAHTGRHIKKRTVYLFMGLIFATAFAASFIPFSERSQVLSGNNGWLTANVAELLGYGRYSGAADFNRNDERVLFQVMADEPIYLIRQVFGPYDGTRWIAPRDQLTNGLYNWEDEAKALNYDRFFACVREAEASIISEQYPDDLLAWQSVEQLKSAVIMPQNCETTYILAPARTFQVTYLPSGITHARNGLDEIFVANQKTIDSAYTIGYYAESFRENPALQDFAKQFNKDTFEELIDTLLAYNTYTDQAYYDTLLAIQNKLADAGAFSRYQNEFLSVPVTKLAQSITAGRTSDYEKALALERYFRESGYRYDSSNLYRKQNEDIEAFLLETKTGTCGHYATAMTLMAQISGLNARYVEGFLSAEKTEQGQYVIRAKHSHAFVQVHIPAYGWVTFDPTVPAAQQEEPGAAGQIVQRVRNNVSSAFAWFSGLIVLVLAGYFLYHYTVKEMLFRRKFKKSDGRTGIFLLYRQIMQFMGAGKTASAGALVSQAYTRYGADIRPITDCFERAAFGDESVREISAKEKDTSFAAYIKLYQSYQKGIKGKPAKNLVSGE